MTIERDLISRGRKWRDIVDLALDKKKIKMMAYFVKKKKKNHLLLNLHNNVSSPWKNPKICFSINAIIEKIILFFKN